MPSAQSSALSTFLPKRFALIQIRKCSALQTPRPLPSFDPYSLFFETLQFFLINFAQIVANSLQNSLEIGSAVPLYAS